MKRSILLACILLLAFGLRAWGLSQRELSYYDEGSHWRVAYAPAVALRTAAAALREGRLPARKEIKEAVLAEGFPEAGLNARHGYYLFLVSGMTLAGLRDDIGFWVNATAGSLTVLAVYRIGTLLRGPALGLSAAFLLAVSPNHVFYSRGGLSQATSLFFVYGGLLALLRAAAGTRNGFFRAGCLLGYGFTCHYNLFWILPFASAWTWLSQKGKGGGRPLWALVGGFLAFPLIFEAASALVAWLVSDRLPGLVRYSREIAYQFEVNTGGYSAGSSTPLFYFVHWIRTEGPLFTALSLGVAGLFAVVGMSRPTRRGLLAVGGLVLVPHLLYAPLSLKGARTLLVAVPAACLCAAWATGVLLGRPGRTSRWTGAILLAIMVGGMLSLTARVVEGQGPYRRVLGEIARRDAHPVTVDDYPILLTYTRGADILVAARETGTWRIPLDRIRRDQPEILLAVLNRGGLYGCDDPVWRLRFGLVREVLDQGRPPVAVIPFGHPLEFDYVDAEWSWPHLLSLSGLPYQVEIYDLEGVR